MDNTPRACPPDYEYYSKGHKCYKFSSGKKRWENARDQCLLEGANLVIIKDMDTEKFISKLLIEKHYSRRVWVGLKEIENSRTYKWVDETPLEYIRWSGGNPSNDNQNGPDCIELVPRIQWNGQGFNDRFCSSRLHYLCERPLTVYPACPSGYTTYNYNTKQKCVRVVHGGSGRLTWDNARRSCQQDGGDLVVIEDEDYDTFIESLLRVGEGYWIGLNRGSQYGDFLQWVDGSPLAYTQWASGQPDNYMSMERCGVYSLKIGNEGWDDNPCWAENGFLCQQNSYEPSSCRGENWVSNREHKTCYLIQKDERTFHDSRIKCQQQGGDLVMTTTDDERLDYFRALLRGLNSQHVWINGVIMPTASATTNYCSALNPNATIITQDACDSPKSSMCERAMVKDGPLSECPHGYTTYVTTTTGWSITCLMADNSQNQTMSGARLACKDDGGDLYSYIPNESDMNSFVTTNLLVPDHAYWYKSDCRTCTDTTWNSEADCVDKNDFICNHWGNMKETVQLRNAQDDRIGQDVNHPNAPHQSIPLVEMCRSLNTNTSYTYQHDWIRTANHVTVTMERNWTALTMENENMECHFIRQNDCCTEVVFDRPADLTEELQMNMNLPKDKINCLCTTPVTNEIIDLLNNLTKSTQNSSSPPQNKLCPCRCGSEHINFNPSPKELALIISKIQIELKVDTTTLSFKQNKKVSASDTRKESIVIGYIGVVLCLIPVSFLVSVDLIRFVRFIQRNKIDAQ